MAWISSLRLLGLQLLLLLSGCSLHQKTECQQLSTTVNTAMQEILKIQANHNTDNALATEQQIAQQYFGASQSIEALELSTRRLQDIQSLLVEAYQKASDYRYQALEWMPSKGAPTEVQIQQIQALQQQADADLVLAIQTLDDLCR